MPHLQITHLTFPKIARLAGLDPSNVWRRATKGEFGPVSGERPKRLSIAEVEIRLGRVFTPDQVEAAFNAGAFKRPPKKPPNFAGLYTRVQLAMAIEAALDERDAQWKRWIRSQVERSLYPVAPPRPSL